MVLKRCKSKKKKEKKKILFVSSMRICENSDIMRILGYVLSPVHTKHDNDSDKDIVLTHWAKIRPNDVFSTSFSDVEMTSPEEPEWKFLWRLFMTSSGRQISTSTGRL